MAKTDLTAARLRARLGYDPESGIFTYMPSKYSKMAGRHAGNKSSSGYLKVVIDGQRYMLHRLAWLHVHGEWTEFDIDHINGNPLDNRICNLRPATDAVNSQNQVRAHSNNASSGLLGVSYKPSHRQWAARIFIDGKSKHIGYFRTAELAHQAYLHVKRREHPGCTI